MVNLLQFKIIINPANRFFFFFLARLDLAHKVSRILTKQLEIEVERQQSEIAEIEQSILKVQQNLLLLRYVAARSYYTSKSLVSFSLYFF